MEKAVSRKFTVVRVAICFLLFLCVPDGSARGKPLEKASLALQWLTQCQFAGYYVALDKGFYRREGIDLTIIPGAPDVNPIYLVSSGIANFGTKWLGDFLAAKDKGFPLISIAQILQSNGLILLAKAKSGIRTPEDLMGKKLGIWFFGNETQFFALMHKRNISLNKMHIDALKWSIKPFLDGKFDVVMAMIYNEYLRVLDSGYEEKDINIIDFSQYDLNFPGQVIFTSTAILKNRQDLCERMVRASLQGWKWAMEHPEEAVDIVLKYDETRSLQKKHQLRQMKAINKLIKYGNRPLGRHLPEQVVFVMKSLLENKVVSRELDLTDVYTNQIWERAQAGMDR